MITSQIDISQILRKFGRVPEVMRQPLNDLAGEQAKLFVSNNRSGAPGMVQVLPPSSPGVTGKAAEKQGKAAVRRDIKRVYALPGAAYAAIQSRDPKQAAAFWRLSRSRRGTDLDAARRILRANGGALSSVEFDTFDGGKAHADRRDARGRVKGRRPDLIVQDVAKLERYIREKQKKVGTLASAYNAAGLRFGSTGIGKFILEKGNRFSQVDVTSSRNSFLVRMTPRMPFGRDEIIRRIPYVLRYRQRAMQKRLEYITRAAVRNAGIR